MNSSKTWMNTFSLFYDPFLTALFPNVNPRLNTRLFLSRRSKLLLGLLAMSLLTTLVKPTHLIVFSQSKQFNFTSYTHFILWSLYNLVIGYIRSLAWLSNITSKQLWKGDIYMYVTYPVSLVPLSADDMGPLDLCRIGHRTDHLD